LRQNNKRTRGGVRLGGSGLLKRCRVVLLAAATLTGENSSFSYSLPESLPTTPSIISETSVFN
jgi:hypothetical protein